MTNKPMLSVERELLSNLSYAIAANDMHACVSIGKELRALLDEPNEPFNPQGWSIDHSAGRPILMHNKCSVIEAEQAYGLLNLIETAAQHQVDPVVPIFTKGCTVLESGNGKYRIVTSYQNRIDAWADYEALCRAEQPAPVAVVMP